VSIEEQNGEEPRLGVEETVEKLREIYGQAAEATVNSARIVGTES
jgi:hypothetical protein